MGNKNPTNSFCSVCVTAMVDSDERQGDDTLFFILYEGDDEPLCYTNLKNNTKRRNSYEHSTNLIILS